MEKMGGAGDLGDSAAAYGCNDWGASSFSDGSADFGAAPDASWMAKDAVSAGGHIDQYTFGDASADAAREAARKNAEFKALHDAAKRAARGF